MATNLNKTIRAEIVEALEGLYEQALEIVDEVRE